MKISEQSLYCIKKVVPPALAMLRISPRSGIGLIKQTSPDKRHSLPSWPPRTPPH